jgi:hypothetical protein
VRNPDQDDMRRAAARRRAKSPNWGVRLFRQPPLEGESKRWVWAVVGVIVLLLFAFVSGVRIGKELAHPDEKKAGTSLPPEKNPFRIGDAGKTGFRDPEGKPALFEGVEKSRGKEAPENKGSEKSPEAEGKEAKTPSRTAGSAPAAPKAAQPPKAKYALQIAALNSAEEARELVQKLKSRGYEAYAVTGSAAAKGSLHRVRIGSFLSLTEAREFAVEFEKKEKIRTIIATLQNS